MRSLVVFDTLHGNTAKVAEAIGDALPGEVSVNHVGEVSTDDLKAVDLLIVGSPTHGGWFTEPIKGWLNQIPATALEGIRVAAFDTRTRPTTLSRLFGFAAPRIASSLEKKGVTVVVPPEGFLVEGIKGPLTGGEHERAAGWAQQLAASAE
jgi:flavodoxin